MGFTYSDAFGVIIPCALIAILYAGINFYRISKVQIDKTSREIAYTPEQDSLIHTIGKHIQEGSKAFLHQEYKYLLVFLALFALVILVAVDIVGESSNDF